MAKIVIEQREFKDNNSGIVTKYEYIAIKGTGADTAEYEVQLKNLVQSEKMALKMIAKLENIDGEVTSRKAGAGESPTVAKNLDNDDEAEDWLND